MSSYAKTNIIIAISIIAYLFLVFTSLHNTNGQKEDDTWKQSFRQDYIKSCNSNGKLYSYCNCTAKFLTDFYTLDQLKYITSEYQHHITPEAIYKANSACHNIL